MTRNERAEVALLAGELVLPPRRKRRIVFDAQHGTDLPGRRVRGEGEPRVRDVTVNEAYESAGRTYDYFRHVHGRFSVDDRALRLESTVHYGDHYSNAQWDGRRMIYGDGDGKYFHRFTSSLDVIAHELTHGVIQYTAALGYTNQSGALGEHFSDVFGILTKQYHARETALRSDWLIGKGLFTKAVNGEAIRSLKAPGTAYDDPVLGRDPQPAHIRKYVRTSSDGGGVHINSGIPNHAFYQVATLLGGRAWEVAGRIWYDALVHRLGPRARFQQCADATWSAAGAIYGAGSAPQEAVLAGWRAVGIDVSASLLADGPRLRVRTLQEEEFVPPMAAAEIPQFV